MAMTPIADRLSGAARRFARPVALTVLAALLTACGGDYAPQKDAAPPGGPKKQYNPNETTVFGDKGVSVGNIRSLKGIFGSKQNNQGQLPVNKYLWQASLDTLSFLPLASSDPFTGVIATDWGTTPQTPTERVKVTAFITSSALSAASLKVAVYREVRNADGVWVPAPVSAETPRKLEDAILTRARQIRIAEREGKAAG